MKISRLVLAVGLLVASGFATPIPILPKAFGGWQAPSVQSSPDPAIADPTNAALLKEYGFTDVELATYVRDGRKLTIRAARFKDASGAYGAFTYYKTPSMVTEKFGDQGASFNERVLFYRGNIVVDAVFEGLTAMSAAELRELAGDLPFPRDNTAQLPGLPAYLPRESYEKNTAKYVVGPVGLEKISAPLPVQLVDFSADAEVVTGKFTTSQGTATLMLISYPTPAIAGEHLKKIDEAQPANAPIFDKRTGPLVVIVGGHVSSSEAKALLAEVNYEANVTWNENTHVSPKDNIGSLVVNILYLCFILAGICIVAGVAFGGLRLLIKRWYPGRFFDRPEDVEFISLHLTEKPSRGTDS
ncbi:MAG TPA: DUF6599 family protein [Terriglobales bacterium]|nr:DUF6599 family protein [Terriglobales bacterium]